MIRGGPGALAACRDMPSQQLFGGLLRCLNAFAGPSASLVGGLGWSCSRSSMQPAAATGTSGHCDIPTPSPTREIPFSPSLTTHPTCAGYSQTVQPLSEATPVGPWHKAGRYPARSSLSSWQGVMAPRQLHSQQQCRQHQTHAPSDASRADSSTTTAPAQGASIDPKEAAKFAALADSWWRSDGPFAPLHALNPTRVKFMRDAACDALGLDHCAPEPFAGLRVLDVGCGGGILSEALARLGASVHGIDITAENVAAARVHSLADPLVAARVSYEVVSAEELAARGARYDVVVASEVLEHVSRCGAVRGRRRCAMYVRCTASC